MGTEQTVTGVSQALGDTISQLNQFIQDHAAQGMDAAMQAMMFAGKLYSLQFMYDLAFAAVWMVISGSALVYCFAKRKPFFVWAKQAIRSGDDAIIPIGIFGSLALVALIATFIVNLNHLLNPITWAAALDPKIALAAHLLKL